ncbi:PP2C family serine/threonine-protein phosphatase [Exiguobacterium sp. TNDT2]|uniref:PP2C family serine/threonine-protein phosphatase n=1 Tax=Exiguobacterium sp. TNDT2 TaxID=2233531 RepID=UPI000DEEDB71|nr:protein phosphatase 2C domain-containing protein [Exiguobacterium sp. TNDT2]
MTTWKVASAATIGRSHMRLGIPCQDAVFSIMDDSCCVSVLSDGAGSASQSEAGAHLVSERLARFFHRSFDRLYQLDSQLFKQEVAALISAWIDEEAESLNCQRKELAATALVAAISNGRFLLLHVGDGVIGYSKEGITQVASMPKNGEFANETVFVTSSNLETHMTIFKGTTELIDGFILMSDGTAESLYAKRQKQLAPGVSRLLAQNVLYTSSFMNDLLKQNLNHVIRQQTHDDCSLVVMSRPSNAYRTYRQLSLREKCDVLGVSYLHRRLTTKRLERTSYLLSFLDTPMTIKQLAIQMSTKPRFVERQLGQLERRGLVSQNAGRYQA